MTHTHDELQAVKPLRQEQEQAEEPITEIAEGIYRMQLPVSMPGLGHVNCYALEDEEGFVKGFDRFRKSERFRKGSERFPKGSGRFPEHSERFREVPRGFRKGSRE